MEVYHENSKGAYEGALTFMAVFLLLMKAQKIQAI